MDTRAFARLLEARARVLEEGARVLEEEILAGRTRHHLLAGLDRAAR